MSEQGSPRVLDRRTEYVCPWLEVESKGVSPGPGGGKERFFSVKTEPYIAVLAVTHDDRIPFVRLFRPAVEEVVLELPSGRVESGETHEVAARRELLEETGCRAAELRPIAVLFTDTGRMQTRQWAFFAPEVDVVAAPSSPDEDLTVSFVRRSELRPLVARGEIATSAHLGVLCAAWAKGLIEL
jgi:ADP-ribose pyrophosphatase